jgi:hypothetical protein
MRIIFDKSIGSIDRQSNITQYKRKMSDKSQVMSETLNLKQLMDNPDEYVDNTKYIREVNTARRFI